MKIHLFTSLNMQIICRKIDKVLGVRIEAEEVFYPCLLVYLNRLKLIKRESQFGLGDLAIGYKRLYLANQNFGTS